MTARTAARLAWSLCAASVSGIGGLLVLKMLNGPADLRSAPLVTAPLAFSVVGALVAARQQRNPVGWQLLAVGVFMTATLVGESYARYALITAPGALPGGLYGAWWPTWTYAPIVTILVIFLPLYFPTGQLLSPRWRPVVWSGIGFLVLAVAGNALSPGPNLLLPGLAPVPNPVVFLPEATPLFELFRLLAWFCSLAGIAGAIAALVVRFRRSRGIERQQLKWFTYAAALTPLPFLAHDFAPGISGLLQTLILPLMPISVGIAILRYRLYEIDHILNRTLVYGLLTVILGLCYAAGSLVFVLVAGTGADPPSWLVAAATLAAAAIFRPARRRIQAAVDRRFNRRRYNTASTIQAFSTRLRDQVDLDTLASELLAVVDQTMEPTQAWLWLRPPPPGSPGTAPVRHGRSLGLLSTTEGLYL